MGEKESVAQCADALSEVEQEQGRERKHHQKKTKSITLERRKPKGNNPRAGERRGGMTPPLGHAHGGGWRIEKW